MLNTTIRRFVYASATAQDEVTFASLEGFCEESFPAGSVRPPGHRDLRLHHAAYSRMVNSHNGGKDLPVRLSTLSEVPVGSGLGSSSAITVAIVRCLDAVMGLGLDKGAVASTAHDIERRDLGLKGGRQDHYAAAHGGMNFIEFNRDGSVMVEPVAVSADFRAELEHSIILYFTGVSRESSNIIQDQLERISGEDSKAIEGLHLIKRNAYEMREAMERGDVARLGELFHESWLAKRETGSKVSTPMIDGLYKAALDAGALGGKISGAGGGGFMILLCRPEKKAAVLKALPDSDGRDCSCSFDSEGSVTWRAEA